MYTIPGNLIIAPTKGASRPCPLPRRRHKTKSDPKTKTSLKKTKTETTHYGNHRQKPPSQPPLVINNAKTVRCQKEKV